MKGSYHSSLGNEVEIRHIMNVCPKSWIKIKISKNRDAKTLISSYHWKTLVPFCLQKKRPENAFLTLILNYRKIVQKNKSCHPKQQ